jgi:NitT/TauT family transport system permease protein
MEGGADASLNSGLYVSAIIVITYGCLFYGLLVRQRLVASLICTGERRGPRRIAIGALYWTSPLLFLAVWGIASYSGLAPTRTLPSPDEFARSLWALTASGTLPVEALISFKRIVVGFTLASVIGVPVGLFAGTFLVGRQLIMPVNSFLRYIPPTAFIALLIVYFGVDEGFKYAVVFLGVIFFIVQMVVDVVDDVDHSYVEIALTSGLSNWEIFRTVIVPFGWPRVFDVLRINLSAAWTFLVAAELIGAERGLGHFIAVSQRFLRLGDLYSGILAFGVIGLATDTALERLARRLFRWYYVALKG